MGEGATDSAKIQKGNDLFSHIQGREMIYARQVFPLNRRIISMQMYVVGCLGGVWMNMCVQEHMHSSDYLIFFIKNSSFSDLDIQ